MKAPSITRFYPADRVIAAMRKGPADVIPHGGLRVGVDVARLVMTSARSSSVVVA